MWASLKETWERKGGKGGGDERTVQQPVRERRGVLEREAPPMGGTHGKIRSDAWENLNSPHNCSSELTSAADSGDELRRKSTYG